jgi:hypothetical protein
MYFSYLTTHFTVLTNVWITTIICKLPQMKLMVPNASGMVNRLIRVLVCCRLTVTAYNTRQPNNAARYISMLFVTYLTAPSWTGSTQSDTQSCPISLPYSQRLTMTYLQRPICVRIQTTCIHTLHTTYNGKLYWLRTSRTHTNITMEAT